MHRTQPSSRRRRDIATTPPRARAARSSADDDAARVAVAMSRASAEAVRDALRKKHPDATLELAPAPDGRGFRLTCVDTGHARTWRDDGELERARSDVEAHLIGGKFRAVVARRREREALRAYEPHVVPSAAVDGYVFCRLTGARVRATERAIVRHGEGKKFAAALARASGPNPPPLLTEKSLEEEARERETKAREHRERAEANARAKEEARVKMEAERAKRREVKKRRRENGGYDDVMGCWVPPASEIQSDDDEDDSDASGDGGDTDADAHNDLEDDFYDDDDDSDSEDAEEYDSSESDAEDEELVAVVRRPGFGKKKKQRTD